MLFSIGKRTTARAIVDHLQGFQALFVYGLDRHGNPLQRSIPDHLATESGVRGSLIGEMCTGAG
jgi:hypothetical protein